MIQEAHVERATTDPLAVEDVHLHRWMAIYLPATAHCCIEGANAILQNYTTVSIEVIAILILGNAYAVAAYHNALPRSRQNCLGMRVRTEVLLCDDDVREGRSLPIFTYLFQDG